MAAQVVEQEHVSTIGWPFGLQPLNSRLGVETFPGRDPTLFTTSSASFSSSSGLETESTVSFFADRSVSLGRLIGLTYARSVSSSVRQSRASYVTQGIWFPHYRGKKKNDSGNGSSWLEWLSKLRPFQIVKATRRGDNHGRGSLPSLGQLLNLEQHRQSFASTRGMVNAVYTDSSVNNFGNSERTSSLDPLVAPSSQKYGSVTTSSIAALAEMETTSAADGKTLAKATGCMICFRRNILEE